MSKLCVIFFFSLALRLLLFKFVLFNEIDYLTINLKSALQTTCCTIWLRVLLTQNVIFAIYGHRNHKKQRFLDSNW